jgi:hypothetical protein
VQAGLHLVARTMIARHGARAAANAASRARLLEACGDRDTSRYWDLVREQIEELGHSAPRRAGYYFDDEPDPVAAVRQAAFGDGAPRDEPGDGDDQE